MLRALEGEIVAGQIVECIGTGVDRVPLDPDAVGMARLKIVHDRTVRNAVTLVVVRLRGIEVPVHPHFLISAGPVSIWRRAIGPLVKINAECHGFYSFV